MNEMQAHGLLIPVGSMPIEVWIDKNNSLDELQNFVNGNVDVLRVLGNGVDLWFNKEYLFNGSQPNRAIYATKHMEEVGYLDQLTFGHPVKEGELYSLICGDFVAFGVDEEGEIASLPRRHRRRNRKPSSGDDRQAERDLRRPVHRLQRVYSH